MDGDGIWYAMPDIGTVERYSLSENKVTHSYSSLFETPEDITLIRGILFVCDSTTGTVFEFDPLNGVKYPRIEMRIPVWSFKASVI